MESKKSARASDGAAIAYREVASEVLGVSPLKTALIFDSCVAQVYNWLARGELASYKDGKSRKITMASIRARQARLLNASKNNTPKETDGTEHVAA